MPTVYVLGDIAQISRGEGRDFDVGGVKSRFSETMRMNSSRPRQDAHIRQGPWPMAWSEVRPCFVHCMSLALTCGRVRVRGTMHAC